MQFTVFQESRKGARRVNQDRLAYTYSRDALLMVVADGMGGHAGGEIAAEITVRLMVERFQQEATPVLRDPFLFLHDSLLRAHDGLGQYAKRFSLVETPRTTCVCCIVQGEHAFWAHVGDSRLYVFRRGGVLARTKDHSKVQWLIDQRQITEKQAASHPDRNKIFSCLGGVIEPVIDLSRRTPLRFGDVVALCSDGFWSVYPEDELCATLTGASILAVGPTLVKDAEERGGADGDNVSLLAMRWGPENFADPITETDTMPLGEFTTEIERTVTLASASGGMRDLTEEEIEQAIEEIRSTIARYRK